MQDSNRARIRDPKDSIDESEVTLKVYEIGYLLVSSIPREKVGEAVSFLKNILSKKGASMIAEEDPELRPLSYSMVKKIGAANRVFSEGYFGWFKFELNPAEIEEVKKSFESQPDVLRMLLITTVKENTYLGKKAVSAAPAPAPIEGSLSQEPVVETLFGAVAATEVISANTDAKTLAVPASLEEMDKSIDEMVKGA